MEHLHNIKQRFGIIGNHPLLNRALEKALQIAATEISVLVVGESGVGKEFIPKIIHQNSTRKHQNYIAVNCGAIPQGTIDSELFGHEKGAFTGAEKLRKGYFEVADGGTIFLDEVGELPLSSQVRLLRVLENGEFIKVGSSQVQRTNARVIAATNINIIDAIEKKKFREDLYYRLNTVQIDVPPLRKRSEDIFLLFRKFTTDFSEKYRIPPIQLTKDAAECLKNYFFPGNIRQLRNFAEQITVLETERILNLKKLREYLPVSNSLVINKINSNKSNSDFSGDFSQEREVLYQILFDIRKDLNDLKSLTLELIKNPQNSESSQELIQKIFNNTSNSTNEHEPHIPILLVNKTESNSNSQTILNPVNEYSPISPVLEHSVEESDYEELSFKSNQESLSILESEVELIKKALEKHNGKRRNAASELGISERTLYRKIKQFNLDY